MLSPVQSNKILLTETSGRKNIDDDTYVKPLPPTEQKNEGIHELNSVEDNFSKISLTYKDHDYCIKEVKYLKEIECSKNKDGLAATCDLLPLQNCSQFTKDSPVLGFSKSFLKTVGLTNINLETLADTRSISLSLHDVKISGATVRHEKRVKLRRKDFLKVMKSDKTISNILSGTYLEDAEMKNESLNVDITMRQIELITDLLYHVHALPNRGWHLLSHDPSNSTKYQEAEVKLTDELTSFYEEHEEKLKQKKDHRLLLTQRMASISPLVKEKTPKDSSCLNDNPPTMEKSRSVSFVSKNTDIVDNDHKESVANNRGDSSPRDTEVNKPCDNNQGTFTRHLRSRKIKLIFHSPRNPQQKSVGSCQKTETMDELEKPSELARKYEQLDKPTEMINEWITVSETWLREGLDVESMLQLI